MRKLSWAIRFPVIRFMGNYKLNGTFLDMVPVKDIDSFSWVFLQDVWSFSWKFLNYGFFKFSSIEVVNATVTTDTRLNLGLASLMSNSFKMKMTLEEVQVYLQPTIFPFFFKFSFCFFFRLNSRVSYSLAWKIFCLNSTWMQER